MTEEKPRRDFLKVGSAAVIAGVIAGVGGYFAGGAGAPAVPVTKTVTEAGAAVTKTVTKTGAAVTKTVTGTAAPTTAAVRQTVAPTVADPGTPMVWAGGSWAMYPEMEREWKKITGQDLQWTTISIPEMLAKLVATGGKGMDIIHPDTSNSLVFVETEGVCQPCYIDKLPDWKWEEIAPAFKEPENVVGLNYGKDNAEYLANTVVYRNMWWPGKKDVALATPPNIYNYDSICWNPEFIDYTVTSWGSIVDRQFKGKASIQDVFVIALNEWAAYLVNSGQMPKPERGINDLTPAEVDVVADFLISHKKAGQFKAFWPDYGSAVNLHVGREVWISDGWQPVEYDVRRGGCPCWYADPDEGYRMWYSGDMFAAGTNQLDTCYAFQNWHLLGGWHAKFIVRNGYFVMNYPAPHVRDYFEREYYDWHYSDIGTYMPIDEIMPIVWPDRPEFWDLPDRVAGALFVPENNAWSDEVGKPNVRGIRRDGGNMDRHWAKTATWQTWPADADYYAEAWDRLKAA